MEVVDQASLPFLDERARQVALLCLYSQRDGSLFALSSIEARESGEERVQLLEGCYYEYEVVAGIFPGLRLQENIVVRRSNVGAKTADIGRISPGNRTGVLQLVLENEGGDLISTVSLEVRSVKLDYREDYRRMMENIADKTADLIMDLRSSVAQRLLPGPGYDLETLQFRFAFLKSLIYSRGFQDAVQRVISAPYSSLEEIQEETNIRMSQKLSGRDLHRLAFGQPRIPVPDSHPLSSLLVRKSDSNPSLPSVITSSKGKISTDIPENRFVKHVLSNFVDFLEVMERKARKFGEESWSFLIRDINRTRNILETYLAADFFREITQLDLLPVSSPVLQRKAGYRDILKAWMKFDLAATLTWSGGEDVYGGGKRDTALLYEYWLFFQLLDLVASKFYIQKPSLYQLFERRNNGFGLKLRAGSEVLIYGECIKHSRRLKVRFSYNRTFSYSDSTESEGSWTTNMRPDFTLSIWPAAFSPEEAERQDLIVHIHFDSKYRAESVEGVFGNDDINLSEEKNEEKAGIYKRGDLLKMHAYRDAIRRSGGAYVLYPGTRNRTWEGYHELLPGLGAFAVRPGNTGKPDGLEGLSIFIDDVVLHLCNRASNRERLSYHKYVIYSEPSHLDLHVDIPEVRGVSAERVLPPAEHIIFLGICENFEVLNWSFENQLYTLSRDLQEPGVLDIVSEMSKSMHMLLFSPDYGALPGLWLIKPGSPYFISSNALEEINYPGDFGELAGFFAADIEPDPAYSGFEWDISKLVDSRIDGSSSFPVVVNLVRLMASCTNESNPSF